MALTQPIYLLLRKAWDAGLLPQKGAILEFGEANWYDDMPITALLADLATVLGQEPRRREIFDRITELHSNKPDGHLFAIAKLVYTALFEPEILNAIDFHGTSTALRLDLNQPIALDRQYDVTMNNGTAEHILNIGQFLKTMHECTKPGGIILHEAPFNGWIDHGFYTLQPTLFFDIAAANQYDLLGLFYIDSVNHEIKQMQGRETVIALIRSGGITSNASLYAALRKGAVESPFVFPFQDYYAGPISAERKKAWQESR
jgi:hypothetical protein